MRRLRQGQRTHHARFRCPMRQLRACQWDASVRTMRRKVFRSANCAIGATFWQNCWPDRASSSPDRATGGRHGPRAPLCDGRVDQGQTPRSTRCQPRRRRRWIRATCRTPLCHPTKCRSAISEPRLRRRNKARPGHAPPTPRQRPDYARMDRAGRVGPTCCNRDCLLGFPIAAPIVHARRFVAVRGATNPHSRPALLAL